MNSSKQIRVLQNLHYSKFIRHWRGYTFFSWFVFLLQIFLIFLTYTDTSLLLTTKIVLIIIQVQLAIMVLTKYEDLNFFQSIRLTYWYYMSPKKYQTAMTNDEDWNENLENLITFWNEIRELEIENRKVVFDEWIKKIEKVESNDWLSKIKKITDERIAIEIWKEKIKKDNERIIQEIETKSDEIDLLSMIKINDGISSRRKPMKKIERIVNKDVWETVREALSIDKKVNKEEITKTNDSWMTNDSWVIKEETIIDKTESIKEITEPIKEITEPVEEIKRPIIRKL